MTLSWVVIDAEGERSASSVTGGWREHLGTFKKDRRRTSLSIAFPETDILVGPENLWCRSFACTGAGEMPTPPGHFSYRTFSAIEIVVLDGVSFAADAVCVGRQPVTRAAPGILAATNRTVLAGTESLVARLGLWSSNSSTAPRRSSVDLVEGVCSDSRVADFVFGNSVSGVGRKAVFVFAGARARALPAGTRR